MSEIFIYSKRSKFLLTRNQEAYMKQLNADGSVLFWNLFDAKQNGYDALHLEPDWRVGDVLTLFKGNVSKRITITAIEQ